MNTKTISPIVAGVLPFDANIEFVGIADTKEVLWLRNGNNHYFKDLPEHIYQKLEEKFLSDEPAVRYLSGLYDDIRRQVEVYTFYLYGDLDTIPDYNNATGELGESENFFLDVECPSLDFTNKHITVNGNELTKKELKIIKMIKQEYPDKLIASKLGIAMPTLDYHKKRLYAKAGVTTKAGLINIINMERI